MTVLDGLEGLNERDDTFPEGNDFQEDSENFLRETEDFFNENSVILNDIEDDSDIPPISLTVTSFEDQNDGSSVNGLSLRDAILRAQSDRQNRYIIFLPAGTHNLSIQGNQDSLFEGEEEENIPLNVDDIVTRTGDLDINTQITIVGTSPGETIIDASGLGDRLFDVRFGGFLTLENVTIQGGTALNTTEDISPTGGGIRVNEGSQAIVNNSIIRDNSTVINEEGIDNPNGGGIANFGVMEINNTIVSENLSGDDGGGIYNLGTMSITGSTIAGNFANAAAVEIIEAGGGGIYNTPQGDLIIRNSTISGNITGDGGGGILSESINTVVINTTIADNSAQIGSGILSSIENQEENQQIQDGVILQNSIVARNIDSADIEGFFAPNSSHNVIGNGNGILLNGVNGNIVGDVLSPLDPLISPLQNNGGPTPTYALLDGSPAINGGDNNLINPEETNLPPLTTDQRGSQRIVGGLVDIGSYELLTSTTSRSTNGSLNTPIIRFQNSRLPGTYLYAGEQESQSIRANNPEFVEEGFAFNVGVEPGDDLILINRFQNTSVPGTYLYAGEEESISIRQNNPNFREEGIAFYVYGADANKGEDIYRLQNSQIPGTYIFVRAQERENILQNFTHFIDEGVAFEVGI